MYRVRCAVDGCQAVPSHTVWGLSGSHPLLICSDDLAAFTPVLEELAEMGVHGEVRAIPAGFGLMGAVS